MNRVPRIGVLVLVHLLVVAGLATAGTGAAADDDLQLHRTTPRSRLVVDAGGLRFGVPGGRAWGVESALQRVPAGALRIQLHLSVTDPSVREAFVRVAWYESAVGRPRQVATVDSGLVRFGDPNEEGAVDLALDPPDGTVAYRVRVLARLRAGLDASRPDAVRASRPLIGSTATPLTHLVAPGTEP